jgi:hypothetical protein
MENPPHPMRLGESEEDYYRQGPSFAAAQPADLLSMLARSRGAEEASEAAGAAEHGVADHGADEEGA